MNFQDQTLTCRDCGNTFTWTASEQQFYADKGFNNAPVRCPDCRAKKKASMGGSGRGFGGPAQKFDAVCSNCGQACQVPFQPKLDETGKPVRPIYCTNCYKQMRTA